MWTEDLRVNISGKQHLRVDARGRLHGRSIESSPRVEPIATPLRDMSHTARRYCLLSKLVLNYNSVAAMHVRKTAVEHPEAVDVYSRQ
jgi:hypothetical protein